MMKNLKLLVAGLVAVAFCYGAASVSAQSLRPLNDSQAIPTVETAYALTKTARSVDDFTEIIDQCRSLIADSQSSDADRKYLNNLVAWTLNRRAKKYFSASEFLTSVQSHTEAKLQLASAIADFQSSIELDKNRWQAWFGLGNALMVTEQYPQAIEKYSRVLKLKPTNVSAMYNRAEANFAIGKYDLALADYTKVAKSDHSDAQAITGRGHCFFKKDELAKSLKEYQLVVRLRPEDSTARCNLGDALRMSGEFENASRQYESATKKDTPSIGYQRLGRFYATCPSKKFYDPAKAVAMATRAVAEGGEGFQNLETLAVAHKANGNQQLAASTLAKARVIKARAESSKGLRVAEQPSTLR